jgi:MamI restriction endonuclease
MDKSKVLQFLKLHHESFFEAKPYADETGHTTPSDTKSWSQILASLLSGVTGLERKKGADLADGSDVKGANTWDAIDTPRFNGVIKAGTKSDKAGKLEYLDDLPYLYFVLWDNEPENKKERCRVWVVRTKEDEVFRAMCSKWYEQRDQGIIKSDNFQLHPPRGRNSNIFTNTCGNLSYPLLFEAVWNDKEYELKVFDENVLENGQCIQV